VVEYSVLARNPSFVDRFVREVSPPDNIMMGIWWAKDEREILRFKSREAAEQIRCLYESHFSSRAANAYSFTVMKTVTVPKWIPA
jgi:hypothetical protein